MVPRWKKGANELADTVMGYAFKSSILHTTVSVFEFKTCIKTLDLTRNPAYLPETLKMNLKILVQPAGLICP